jgi:hypothetical protein
MNEERSFEKRSNIVVGLVLAGAGFVAVLLSFSLLPGIGLLLGIPAIVVGSIFIIKSGRKLADEKSRAGNEGTTVKAKSER